jgi:hypothetical protein
MAWSASCNMGISLIGRTLVGHSRSSLDCSS